MSLTIIWQLSSPYLHVEYTGNALQGDTHMTNPSIEFLVEIEMELQMIKGVKFPHMGNGRIEIFQHLYKQ